MSTLDLTGTSHFQRLPTVPYIRTLIDRFTARYSWNQMELRVLATETSPDTWTISTFPGEQSTDVDDLNNATHVYHGGGTYTVTGSLATALTSGGYTVS